MVKGFLKQNIVEEDEIKVYPTTKFRDEKGELLAFKLKPITQDQAEHIKEGCIETIVDNNNVFVGKQVNYDKYIKRVILASITQPDLTDKELQQSYGVDKADKLLDQMLNFAERAKFEAQVSKKLGLNEEALLADAKLEAKNE